MIGCRISTMNDVNESGNFDVGMSILNERDVKTRVDNFIVVCRSNKLIEKLKSKVAELLRCHHQRHPLLLSF